jgi:hypothetical protein
MGRADVEELETKGQRLGAVCLVSFLLFNYPILALFNKPATAFGIPSLYLYIFAAWALVVALMALIIERSR